MRTGVIARCDPRGLGNQTYDVCLNLHPDRVLLIDPGPDKRFTQHPERYEAWDVTTARWTAGRLDPDVVRPWLAGLDVVYTAETPYDARLPQWAADEGCRVAVHANPEFLSPKDAQAEVCWWVATPWRLDHLPPSTRVVPMPAPDAPFRREPGGPVRFLHVAGWPAVGDRNGTGVVAEAAARMRSGAQVVIRGQHRDITRYRRANVRVEAGNLSDHWDLYRDCDVLVSPRRFGGLHLPALEALACGLPVVMSDTSPNEVWPGPRIPAVEGQTVATRAGLIQLHDTDPAALAACLDELATNPEALDKHRTEARDWAAANGWGQLQDLWLSELKRACA
jgi:glycosyltransferase involved in cell wall biosynthesis